VKRSRDFNRSENDTVWDNFRFFLPAAKFDGFGLVRTRRHAKKAEALLEIPEPRREKFKFQRKKAQWSLKLLTEHGKSASVN
jgi:hypothetical protein